MKTVRCVFFFIMQLVGFAMRMAITLLGLAVSASILLGYTDPSDWRYRITFALLCVFYAFGACMEGVSNVWLKHEAERGK